jgi:tetratricopeptide (TPR) repeat protein
VAVGDGSVTNWETDNVMNRHVRAVLVLGAGLAVLSATGCDKLKARDQLNKGVQSYKNTKYEEAIDHFQNAISLDPSLLNARLYLATAYTQQYIPGADTPDNNRMAQQAIDAYKSVLERDPKNVTSVKGIGYLYMNLKKFDDAKQYYRQAAELDPNDPESHYTVGVIDWTQAYQPAMEERAKLGLKGDELVKDKKVCAALKQKNAAPVQDGMDELNKALQLRPDYDDAMAYLNLLYRRKADDLECDNLAANAADLKTADEWVDKTMATKKANAAKVPGNQGMTMDQDKTQ